MNCACTDFAIVGKDKVMDIIHQTLSNDISSVVKQSDKLIIVMEYSIALWIALDYDYKMAEICMIMIGYIEKLLNEKIHSSQEKMLDSRRIRLYNIINQCNALKKGQVYE
jgi:rRNA pseudouridine-1189 N-methylase Emg1 (Nep1/Mra1 family)